jgi:hypothetical protein
MLGKEIVAGIIAQALLVAFCVLSLWTPLMAIPFSLFIMWGIAVNLLFLGFGVLTMLASMKISREYKYNAIGTIGGVCAILAALIGLYIYGIAPSGTWYYWGTTFHYIDEYFYFPNMFGLLLTYMSYFVMGFALAFIGAFFINYGEYLFPRPLWTFTGLVYLFAAVFSLSLLLNTVSYYALIPAGILGALSLLLGKPRKL